MRFSSLEVLLSKTCNHSVFYKYTTNAARVSASVSVMPVRACA